MTMNATQIAEILEAHQKWLRGDGGARANLRGANLRGANLWGANLQSADLQSANLRGANLQSADLQSANLQSADLRGANLWGANLQSADLRGANLWGANLQSADLQSANLRGANLQSADLQSANLRGANLPFYQICHGELLVWKAAKENRLVQLRIPAEAKRTAALTGRKCRAEYADVVLICHSAGTQFQEAESKYQDGFMYRVGERITPDSYDDDIRVECTHGVHFFLTREEAEADL